MAAIGKFTFVATLIVLFAIGVYYEAQLVTHQREQLDRLHSRHDTIALQLEKLRQQNHTDAAALADLQLQIDSRGDTRGMSADSADARKSSEMQAWLAKLATVQRLFSQHPEIGIPELQLLDDRSWLGAIKGVQLDTDEHTRQALAAIRSAAKREFTVQLSFALQKYLNAHDGDLPPNVTALAPYLDPSIDVSILDRYQMARTGSLPEQPASNGPVILEKTAIDEDFDLRHGLAVGRFADGSGWGAVPGSFGGPGPAAWIDDYPDRLRRARAEFARANNGVTTSELVQLAPYIDPPLPAEKLQKLLDLERREKH